MIGHGMQICERAINPALASSPSLAGRAAELRLGTAAALAKLTGGQRPSVAAGLPLAPGALERLVKHYPRGVVTVEDGLIGGADAGLRGFAGLVAGAAAQHKLPAAHIGSPDPRGLP